MTATDSAVVAVAAHGLAGSRTQGPTAPLDSSGWRDLVDRCRAADLCGFLAAAVTENALPTTGEQRDEARQLEIDSAAASLFVDQRLLTMSAMLAAGGVAHRVLDGPARHHLGYGGSSLRTYRTAELLVSPAALAEVSRLPGAPDGPPSLGGGRATCTFRADVVPDPRLGQTVPLSRMSPGATFALAGHQVAAPTVDELLVVTCLELAVDRMSDRWPLRVRDVAELALSHRLDPEAARTCARDWGVVDVVAEMIALVWQVLDLADKTALSVWAVRVDESRGPGGRGNAARPDTARRAVAADLSRRRLGRRPAAAGAPAHLRRSS